MSRGAKLLAAALVAGAGIWGLTRATEPGDGGSWARVERGDLVIGVAVEGELRAADSATLTPPQIASTWNFKISYLAPEGSEVEAGEPVVRFDATDLERRLEQKIADRDSAAKELEKVATDLEIERRDLELRLAEAEARKRRAALKLAVPEAVAARQDLEAARIEHDLASFQIDYLRRSLEHLAARREADLAALVERRDRAAARVEEIRGHLAQMTVAAPRAGTVIHRRDHRGEKKKEGDSVWRAEKILEIPDLRRMLGDGEIAEADAGRVAVGQPVTLHLDAYPERQYRATVRSIRRAVQRKSPHNPQKVVKLTVELAETDEARMRPGMRFRGTIETERLESVLTIPEDAVQTLPEGTAVTVRTAWGRRLVYPALGRRGADAFAVLSGLEEGDRVLRRSGS